MGLDIVLLLLSPIRMAGMGTNVWRGILVHPPVALRVAGGMGWVPITNPSLLRKLDCGGKKVSQLILWALVCFTSLLMVGIAHDLVIRPLEKKWVRTQWVQNLMLGAVTWGAYHTAYIAFIGAA